MADLVQSGVGLLLFRLLMRERALHDPSMPVPNGLLLARKMWALYIAGRVTLVQKRITDFKYIYMAQKIA